MTILRATLLWATLLQTPAVAQAVSRTPSPGTGLPWVDVTDHGAVGDGVADDTLAIRAALQVATASPGARVLFPPARGYRTTETIAVPVGISLCMQAPLQFDGDHDRPALILGAVGRTNTHVEHVLHVQKLDPSDWADERCIGVLLHNAVACSVEIVEIADFTIGLQCLGSGAGFMHNRVQLGSLLNNKIGVDLTNRTAGSSIGWCNENVFLGGRFQHWTSAHRGLSRYGVRITSQDGTYRNNNNNLFLKPSFELWAPAAAPGEAVPVLVEHGAQNRFESSRDESNSPTFARVLNDSTENAFDLGFNGSATLDDQSAYPASRLTMRRTALVDQPGAVVFLSGPLWDRAAPYDATRVQVAGVHLARSADAGVYVAATGVQLGADHLRLSSTRALGVFVDTSVKKRFVVRRDAVAGNPGRVRIRCYDAAGNVMQDAGTPLITGTIYNAPYWTTSFGGTYYQGADSGTDFYFHVDPSVQSVAVLLTGGTAPIHLRSFSLASVDAGNVRCWPGYEEGVPGTNRAVAMPTTGTWTRGRILYNDDPDPGEPLGWVCVASGTPGTWKPFGEIGR